MMLKFLKQIITDSSLYLEMAPSEECNMLLGQNWNEWWYLGRVSWILACLPGADFLRDLEQLKLF